MSTSRTFALERARATYSDLAAALEHLSLLDSEYISDVRTAWDERLAGLRRFRADASISDEVAAAFEFLSEQAAVAIADATEDPDALVRWLDVYPSSVAELFPPSALTFRVVDTAGRAVASARASQEGSLTAAA